MSWALRRFRQMDMVPSSLKLQGNPPWGGTTWSRVCLYELVQSHCTAIDPSRHNPCLSVSMVSDLLQREQVDNC